MIVSRNDLYNYNYNQYDFFQLNQVKLHSKGMSMKLGKGKTIPGIMKC